MVSEVPVLRAVTQKGEIGETCGLLALLWEMSVRGRLLLCDRIDLLLDCIYLDVVITRLLWSDIMITESQSHHLAAISVFWVSAFPCKPQTILSISAGWFSAHSYRTWSLPEQKIIFLENSVSLKPLSLLHVEGYVTRKGLVQKDLWEERSIGMFSVVSRRTFLIQVLFCSPCSNFFLFFSS